MALSQAADALFSPVQARVLGLLFGQPDRRFQGAELIRLARGGTGAVHRQLQRLEAAGMVETTRVGNQKHYQANRASPLFEELHGLVLKTVGLAGPIREALALLADRIRTAFVFGSVARGEESASSDVDLLVLSPTLTYPDLIAALDVAEKTLARRINPVVMTPTDWQARLARKDPFATRVNQGRRLFIIGAERDAG